MPVDRQVLHEIKRPERRTAPGKAWIRHEIFMQVEPLALGLDPFVRAVGLKNPALLIVQQIGDHHLIQHLRMDGWIFDRQRSEEHTSELQSLMRISYAVFCLKKKTRQLTT